MSNQPNIQGTFSSSLRCRSVWRVMGPILTSSKIIVEECGSQIDDFSFQNRPGSRSLEVTLITPSSIEPSSKHKTVAQLKQFTSSPTSSLSNKAIAFLLSEDAFNSASGNYSLHGLLALQVLLFEHLASPLPVIPIPDAPSFFPCVEEYMNGLADITAPSPSLADSLALLAQAHLDCPRALSEQVTNILSDLFPSLKALSQAARTQEGQAVLVDYLGEEQAMKVFRFWSEDISRE